MVDDDRIEGSATNMKGKVKEGLGKLTGDAKLEGEGKGDQAPARSRTPSAASRTRFAKARGTANGQPQR
jgi:uncharacterized protein YjbJ (UPF0337 family)